MEKGLKNEGLNVDSLPDPANRYTLGEIIGHGVSAKVYIATDTQSENKKVAIKEQKLTTESLADIEEEYKILRDLSDHPNLPDFYGAYLKKDGENQYIWLVMQLCEGGPVTDLVRALHRQAKKMSELHIAFILRETLKALIFLHENHVIHRDVKGSNILLTKDGEVKLVDFGVSRELSSTLGKRQTSIGSPCWMAPEVVENDTTENSFYDNRADVWALGITAIELGDGKAPFEGMHPTRTLFQIVRNPPPTLYRPANWTQNFNDFISECLVKNPEHRPYMTEVIEHPFLLELPENDLHLNVELKSILENVKDEDKVLRQPEIKIKSGLLKKSLNDDPEPMLVQDLAALEVITEDTVIELLESRFLNKQYYTFVGDVLVFLNPGTMLETYSLKHCSKYKFKSRSDNDPHIYSVADTAYQDMMHHDLPQNIILSGETMSGKSTQYKHLVRQLIYLGMGSGALGDKLQRSVDLVHSFGNASTPENSDSTRHALLSQITFSSSGRLSGIIFWLFQLEKWRVTGNRCPHHTNFHIFYYFYDGVKAKGELGKYYLDAERKYCYLRRDIDDSDKDPKVPPGPREDSEGNAEWFERINKTLTELEFTECDIEFVWNVLAAILLLGEVEYKENDDGNAEVKDNEIVEKIASLLSVDSKRLAWGLCNYCVVENDTAARRKHSRPEALQARNVLAQTMYARLVDWLINNINVKLSFSRAIYGDHHVVNILDMFGFECYPLNGLEQLFANSMNEQLHYFYNQKMFISETQDEEEDDIDPVKLSFYNNRETMDEILNKPNGLMHILDEANKMNLEGDFVLDKLKKKSDNNHVKREDDEHLSVAHYTGKITYEVDMLCSNNRDFLPPELTEVLRQSENSEIKSLFTNKLSRSGNVTVTMEKAAPIKAKGKKKWGAALLADSSKLRRCNTTSKGEFSQTKGIRTASTTFRAASLEILKMLATGNSLFVRCIRTRLNNGSAPSAETQFHKSIIRQQIRALGVTDTSKARKNGFSHRIPFEKFLESYQFLAFDFDENVEKTKDNCRLLLIRLKMEGWALGKSKVFLKYYNEEFLSRLYETQVKKIVKVQCMLRQFLARRNVSKKKELSRENSLTAFQIGRKRGEMTENVAATTIQRHMKGYCVRRKYGPLVNSSNKLDNATAMFIREYFKKWRAKSIFQVLLLYRAAKHLEMVYFCQQVHLYNQNMASELITLNETAVNLNSVREGVDRMEFLGSEKLAVSKMPFKLKDLQYCDTTPMCGSVYERVKTPDEPRWDEPFLSLDKFCQTPDFEELPSTELGYRPNKYRQFVHTRYSRDLEDVDELYDTESFNNFELESPVRRRTEPSICETTNSPLKLKSPRQSPAKAASVKATPIRSIPDPPISVTPTENGLIDFRINLKPVRTVSKNDPILEMEMRGKLVNSQNEDDPPYNFQAMLRKTNQQRYAVVKAPKIIMNGNEDFDLANNNPSMNSRNGGKAVRTEILPGFFVIGHITDL